MNLGHSLRGLLSASAQRPSFFSLTQRPMRQFRSSIICLDNFYSELGVGRHATKDEIKKAYFALAKKYHPDVNKTSQAKERFSHISSAYGTLGDEEKRRIYD